MQQEQIIEEILRQLTRIKPDAGALHPDTDLVTELGLESLHVMDLVMELEDQFDLSIPLNLLTDVHTPAQLARCIADLLEQQHGAA